MPAAPESGISRPSQGIHRRSPLGATYDAFDSERYILTFENRAFRDIAANAPYDVVEILTNSATYGGGGIFSLYSTVAADSAWAPYVFVHEFGHHIAGLADEYYTSDVAYLPATERIEPWEPNVTALLDPATLKWKDLVDAGDAAADAVAEGGIRGAHEADVRNGAARSARRTGRRPRWTRCSAKRWRATTALLAAAPYAGRSGRSKAPTTRRGAIYRPQADCIMFTRDEVGFCPVCRRAIIEILDLYARK